MEEASMIKKFLTYSSDSYSIRHIDGKGLGFVAVKELSPGDKVLEENPIIQFNAGEVRNPSYVRSLFTQLSQDEVGLVRRLYNAFPKEADFDVGILRTNCYGLGVDGKQSGLFLCLSRMNHSCRPNCERTWDPICETETLYALQYIRPEEELMVWYDDMTDLTREERQSSLSERWRFECACECCSLTGEAQRESDQRRTFIRNFYSRATAGRLLPTPLFELAKIALEYIDMEGLRGSPTAGVSHYGYQMALQLRDLEEAIRWIRRYHSEFLLATGDASSWTRGALELVNNPTDHPAWNPLRNPVWLFL